MRGGRWVPGLCSLVALVTGCVGADDTEKASPPSCSSLEGAIRQGTLPPRKPEGPFTAIDEGAEVPLEFGSQSSWMLVLAVQVRAEVDAETLSITGRVLTLDGTVLSAPVERELPIQHRENNFSYAINLFLPLEADDPVQREFGWDGQVAVVETIATDACGERVTATRNVVLRIP